VRDRETIIAEIADALPEIMRRLAESRPLSKGEWTLTLAQVRALGVIADSAECTMSILARRLGVSLSTATGLVDRLIKHRLVERAPDPEDRRLVHVRLAPKGRRACQMFHREKRRQMEAALGGLSAKDLESIAASLVLLYGALSPARGGESELSSQEQHT